MKEKNRNRRAAKKQTAEEKAAKQAKNLNKISLRKVKCGKN